MSEKSPTINIIDRKTGKQVQEKVVGESFLRFAYENPVGRLGLHALIKRKFFSWLYGKRMDTLNSARKIESFVKSMNIDMSEAEKQVDEYKTFNEFFIRRLKKGARPVNQEPDLAVSPADGRLLAYQRYYKDTLIQVKGSEFLLKDLVAGDALARQFYNGSMVVVRLAPADYHRFHFPDRGVPEYSRHIRGSYFSVSPISLNKIARVYCENRRDITLFKSDHFGNILIIEVGATCVGGIVQAFLPDQHVERGEEKGYFKFGGSTIILLFKPGVIRIDYDLRENTSKGLETIIKAGESIGERNK